MWLRNYLSSLTENADYSLYFTRRLLWSAFHHLLAEAEGVAAHINGGGACLFGRFSPSKSPRGTKSVVWGTVVRQEETAKKLHTQPCVHGVWSPGCQCKILFSILQIAEIVLHAHVCVDPKWERQACGLKQLHWPHQDRHRSRKIILTDNQAKLTRP